MALSCQCHFRLSPPQLAPRKLSRPLLEPQSSRPSTVHSKSKSLTLTNLPSLTSLNYTHLSSATKAIFATERPEVLLPNELDKARHAYTHGGLEGMRNSTLVIQHLKSNLAAHHLYAVSSTSKTPTPQLPAGPSYIRTRPRNSALTRRPNEPTLLNQDLGLAGVSIKNLSMASVRRVRT